MVLVDKVSDYGNGAKEEQGRVGFWDKNDEIEHQWWNELVLAQPLVEGLQQQEKQPQLPGAAAPNPWPLPQAPQASQQSMEAQQLPLRSPSQEVGGDEHEEVMASMNTVVEVGGVMACDGEKGMMEMNEEEELLQQQPIQQQPQLPGAVDTVPWPPPMPAGLVDESNSD